MQTITTCLPPNLQLQQNSYVRARQTVWNLQALQVPQSQLQKIYFYSILPFDANAGTDAEFSQSINLLEANGGSYGASKGL